MPSGTDFLYADVNTPTLAASNSDLNNLNNAVSRTLAPIYKSNGTRGEPLNFNLNRTENNTPAIDHLLLSLIPQV